MPADLTLFDQVAERLEAATSFSRLEARGTLRLALKDAGLAPDDVNAAQMIVVLMRVLPGKLDACGVADPESVARLIAQGVSEPDGSSRERPEDQLRRLWK